MLSASQPVLHHAFNLGMEPRLVTFRAENAINAQIFAWKVIWLCLHKPKTHPPDVDHT